jgi:hypothetical protein
MRKTAIAIAAACLALAAACSHDESAPKRDVAPPPAAQAPPPAAPSDPQPAPGPDTGDPVIAAALEYAHGLELDSPEQARDLYGAVIRRYPTTVCSDGPVDSPCAEQARRRIRVLDCLEDRGEPKTEPDSAALSASIVQALASSDRRGLTARASCDFLFGPCHSDAVVNDVPDGPLACLSKIAGTSAKAGAAVDASGDWAAYPLSSNPPLTLLLERDEVDGWSWIGLCYDVHDPCTAK